MANRKCSKYFRNESDIRARLSRIENDDINPSVISVRKHENELYINSSFKPCSASSSHNYVTNNCGLDYEGDVKNSKEEHFSEDSQLVDNPHCGIREIVSIPLKSCNVSTPKIFKRRLGKLYKQRIAEKSKGKKSDYFKISMSIAEGNWLPPRSPYCLIQEDLYHSPWQLLIGTIFLTKTQAKKAIPQILQFLERWPTPQALLSARQEEIIEYLKPLGIQHVRSSLIRKFTEEFLAKKWTYPEELHGIGKYGNDSYRIFCVNEWRHVTPDDHKLNLYKNWLLENVEKLGIE
ncbi:uncharacterized protein LOC142323291 isoform X1 [Lycorma delicatula]|uniref:uncharacterized protein LOC142323291 isoform X1 n=1 Tax=Lycorma delicatula TaxID=130591 RepID=UPI003F510529